jgi:predicted amidophosphoribosyltransferase
MPDLCQIYPDYDAWGAPVFAPPTACAEAAIAVVTLACVHEHVYSPAACAGCAAELQRVGEFLVCPACGTGPEPHSCSQSLSIRWTVAA